ncbi:MAG: sulfate ABC transporter substrate-binding protein [Candidatus Hydrogenedentes bacterium]|nr:sulfate ABC transporter substrate-binding protein [Candidatus Hydrogenedentota bacterium]
MKVKIVHQLVVLSWVVCASVLAYGQKITILNVSYDPTRELYKEINSLFIEKCRKEINIDLDIQMSHGGSGKQARSVLEGLEADVVTLALGYDIDMLAKMRNLLPQNWQLRLPNNSCPYTSTIVFLVRKGNPKNIRSWEDLIRSDIGVIMPNPKTSGGARWTYLAIWGYALKKGGEDYAKDFIRKTIKNVPVLDVGARGSTNTFLQGMGDVLLTWENEAMLAKSEAEGKFEIVYPEISILAEPPVAMVDKYVEKHGTQDIVKKYLEFLYTEEAQEVIAKHFYRPVNGKVLEKYKNQFPPIRMFKISEIYPGGWEEAHKVHFASGGMFDNIVEGRQ